MDDLMRTISARLELARLARGESKAAVARAVGVSPSTYGGMVRGHDGLSVQLLVSLAKHFDVSLDWLVGLDRFVDDSARIEPFTERIIK